MDFAKRRKSNFSNGRKRSLRIVTAALLGLLGGCVWGAFAQGQGLGAPQKQSVDFAFGLGNSELSVNYGQNAAAMAKFDKLVRDVANSASARIDSVVITAYSTATNPLGNVDVAEQRVSAVKAYVDPVIRNSQLRQAVVVTGNVVAKNNVMMPDQVFGMLKKVTVTVYMNGSSLAKKGTTNGGGTMGSDESRYMSPFGGSNVFGTTSRQQQTAAQADTHREPQQVAVEVVPKHAFSAKEQPRQEVVVARPAEPQQPAQTKPVVAERESEVILPVDNNKSTPKDDYKKEPVRQSEAVAVTPVAPAEPLWEPTKEEKKALDAELQRFIDSLAQLEVKRKQEATAVAPAPAVVVETPKVSNVQPVRPAVVADNSYAQQGRNPEIDALVQQLLKEQGATATATVPAGRGGATNIAGLELGNRTDDKTNKVVLEEISTTLLRSSNAKQKAIMELEISGSSAFVAGMADAKKIKMKPAKAGTVVEAKPVKAEKLAKQKPVVVAKEKEKIKVEEEVIAVTPIVPAEVVAKEEIKEKEKEEVKPVKVKPVKPSKAVAIEVVPVEEVETAKVKEKEEVKPVKVKPVKPVKAEKPAKIKTAHEPMTLVRPLVAAKTNLAYWAGVAANAEVEFYFAKRWSAMVEGVYTDWNMNLYKKHYAVNEISPEVRYWTTRKAGQYRGLYVGVYGHLGQFDYMSKDRLTGGKTGDYYGAGISVGGYLPFTPHFGMELGLRGGYVRANYDRYHKEVSTYIYESSKSANYFGLTGAKVSLVYRFGLGR